MKSIVSSQVLHAAIRKAINSKRSKLVRVTPTELSLGRIKVRLVSNSRDIYYSQFEFDKHLWIRVLVSLRDLPEQPITCEFDDDHIDINCVVRF
jgi:hypothetical protein